MRVYVVDDNALIQKVVTSYLEADGGFLVVATATNGQAAVRLAEQESPDAIVLDHEMPGGPGLSVLPELRRLCPHARIVMFSSAVEVREQALALGADAFVDKAVELEQLLRELRRTPEVSRTFDPDA